MTAPQLAFASPSQPRPAELGKRIAAWVVDLIVAFALVLLVGLTGRFLRAAGLWTLTPMANDPEVAWHAMSVGPKLLVILAWFVATGPFYFVVFHSSAWQATLGKRVFHIYVTDDRGSRIGLPRAAARWLVQCFLNFFGGAVVSLVTIAATPKKKALHDMVAHTLVVEGRPSPAGRVELWRWLAAFAFPFVWVLGTFIITM